jgi:hypothetical protein
MIYVLPGGSFEHGNEPSGSIKGENIFISWATTSLFINGSAPRSYVTGVAIEYVVHHRLSNCGPRRFARWSAGGYERKRIAIIVSDTERMKNTPIHVCTKTAFVGWPTTESRRISALYNFSSFNYYLRKYFKLLYKNVYGNFNHRNHVSPVHLHALVGVGNFTKVVRVCADRLWSGSRLSKFWETLPYIIGLLKKQERYIRVPKSTSNKILELEIIHDNRRKNRTVKKIQAHVVRLWQIVIK